jgi:hypothetical protein
VTVRGYTYAMTVADDDSLLVIRYRPGQPVEVVSRGILRGGQIESFGAIGEDVLGALEEEWSS